MTATIIKLSDPEVCRFSTIEADVLRRLEEGAQLDAIARELGLAAPMVQEYVRSVLRKVRENTSQSPIGIGNASGIESGVSAAVLDATGAVVIHQHHRVIPGHEALGPECLASTAHNRASGAECGRSWCNDSAVRDLGS